MHPLVQSQEAVSGMSDAFIGKTWPCVQWKMDAAERYSGPFPADEAKAKFPILFVNGLYDPRTSLASAPKASARFEGSVVLTHGGQGHRFIRHRSVCTAKAVRVYFVDGTMPEEEKVCEADLGAFKIATAGGEGAGSEIDGDLKVGGAG